MYNRYVRDQDDFQPVEPASGPVQSPPPSSDVPSGDNGQPKSGRSKEGILSSLLSRLGLGGQKNAGGPGIFQSLKLDELDKGDILLILILLYLFWESEDDEWLIILGILLFTGMFSGQG